jgi:hypothetical protein
MADQWGYSDSKSIPASLYNIGNRSQTSPSPIPTVKTQTTFVCKRGKVDEYGSVYYSGSISSQGVYPKVTFNENTSDPPVYWKSEYEWDSYTWAPGKPDKITGDTIIVEVLLGKKLKLISKSGGGKKHPSQKVHVLGRDRKVTKDGRKSMITYKGKQICLTDARKLEKSLKSKK